MDGATANDTEGTKMVDDTVAARPPVGVASRAVLEAEAVVLGVDPDEFIEGILAQVRSAGFDTDEPRWRNWFENATDTVRPVELLTPEQAATLCAGCGHRCDAHDVAVGNWACLVDRCGCLGMNRVAKVVCPACGGNAPGADCPTCDGTGWATPRNVDAYHRGQDPCPTCGGGDDFCPVCGGDGFIDRPPSPPETRPEPASGPPAAAAPTPPAVPATASTGGDGASRAGSEGLPMSPRKPPPKLPPPQPKRPDPLPIRFGRQVLEAGIPPGEWVRLDQPVHRSIVSKKCREFAALYGLNFRVSLDHVDPDDPGSPRRHHLFCRVDPTADDDEVPLT